MNDGQNELSTILSVNIDTKLNNNRLFKKKALRVNKALSVETVMFENRGGPRVPRGSVDGTPSFLGAPTCGRYMLTFIFTVDNRRSFCPFESFSFFPFPSDIMSDPTWRTAVHVDRETGVLCK